jgi:hypothetical protein
MSLFIANENQQLLYEMINKTPSLQAVFPKGSPPDEKNAWFRGVIEQFYNQISGNITREQLKQINRNVLGYMVEQLQKRIDRPINIPNNNTQFNTLKREHAPEYESREAQYKTLFDTPKPKAIDFSEKLEDEAITNMSELIENHKKMREQELRQFAPLPISYEPADNISVKIMQDIPKDELQPTIIHDKKVQFNLPAPSVVLTPDLSKEIENIHIKIGSIESKINEIFEFVKQSKESAVDIIKNQMNTLSNEA